MMLARAGTCVVLAAIHPLIAADAGFDLFEKKIRPVLAEKCFACHSTKLKSPMAGLSLDTAEGTAAAVRGKLLLALRHTDPKLKMPPAGKLPGSVIADIETWISLGAPDPRPRTQNAGQVRTGPMSLADGRRWWAFQPLAEARLPVTADTGWARGRIDRFILARLESNNLKPSPQAGGRTLIRRAYYDLIGLPPSYEEVESFVNDADPEGFAKVVERLLDSPRYGERWGRHWLDVARWAEDNPTSEATNPPYPYAWHYRDWVIDAIAKDVPYDLFVKMQFAADLLPGFQRRDLRALGYLGTTPAYHKDNRLSKEVIETLASDDWDERVDGVTRGLLGLTVACARCHDHKFDPVTAKDYHALAGVFASTWSVRRPLADLPPETEARIMWLNDRIHHLNAASRLLGGNENSDPAIVRKREKALAELAVLQKEAKAFENVPLTNAVADAGCWIDGSDPDLTWVDFRPGKPRDLPVFLRGNVANPGEIVPRSFIAVLDRGEPKPFRQGSGRLELASKITGEAGPLVARVWVNRVWGWHFGRHLVSTPSDFGSQGDPPSHPELLDDLAARFVSNGWSLKWLHREIMLSATYRQSSAVRAGAHRADPVNKLFWRMNPRRLEIEAWRDSLLSVNGRLDLTAGGESGNLDDRSNFRRTVYGRISRGRLNPLLRLFDYSDPNSHSPQRDVTTTPLQQLFVMNSEFFQDQAAALAARAAEGPDPDRIRTLYRLALARDPKPEELALGLAFVAKRPWADYAQALLGTNEFIFLR
jgi:cytochrome c553